MTQFLAPWFWEKGVKSQFAYIFLFPQFSIFTSCSARASAHCRLVDCNLDHKKSPGNESPSAPWRYRFSSSLPAFLACPQFSSYWWMYFHINFSMLLILNSWHQVMAILAWFRLFIENSLLFLTLQRSGSLKILIIGLTPLIALILISVEPAVTQNCVASVTNILIKIHNWSWWMSTQWPSRVVEGF